ncbi:hypothetical protein ACTJKE_09460 [Ensifer sp. 22521]|uniref:hypothetical protein n=1 Tax=Ensifer sp. 22521 TaxID=3453935 RepID=UPI003F86FAC1
MIDLLAKLNNVRKNGKGWTALCPGHEDRQNSLSIATGDDGQWLLKCHAGCELADITAAIGIHVADLFAEGKRTKGGRPINPSRNSATVQQQGLTLAAYAEAKKLPVEFLNQISLSDMTYAGQPAVRIPYIGPGGELLASRFRIALDGDRFRWKAGSKPCIYGQSRIEEARKRQSVVLVEGESDCHTLWYHGIPALGLPGASSWNESRDAPLFEGIGEIYVVIEPDKGGDAVREWLSRSAIRDRVKLLELPTKDASALYLDDPARFKERWRVASLGALPWTTVAAELNTEERAEAWNLCEPLAKSRNILADFAKELADRGVAGEETTAKVVYLALTSRLLEQPVSLVIKGPSSGGKSYVAEQTLKFFPQSAYYALSAMSERSLAYSDEPLAHRHLVLFEAGGMGQFGSYLMRSLLSEGCLRYETVEKTRDGLKPKLIERPGPTGLLCTTTRFTLHPENETRMLSLTVTDSREQTTAVLAEIARQIPRAKNGLDHWQALQTWLASGACEVIVPYADALARLVPPVAVRLRRDFSTLLSLIKAHALLHAATRIKDNHGRIVATIVDYEAVRVLVVDIIAQGVGATVKPHVKEIISAVKQLNGSYENPIGYRALMDLLHLDKATVSRRAREAIDLGYLDNLEKRERQPARLIPGDPLPEEVEVLPTTEELEEKSG